MNGIWEGLCTLCVCTPCGVGPRFPLSVISTLSFSIGVIWITLGIWLAVVVVLNGSLPFDQQVSFERFQVVDYSHRQPYFMNNESSFVFTPLDNLKFYLVSISVIAIFGGLGRAIASLSLLHYIHKKSLPYVMSWAWVILSMLALVSLGILTVDTLYTLSRYDVAPPYNRDFYFKNDHYGFYTFCHVFKYFILIDFVTTSYFQWVVRWAHRNPLAPDRTTIASPTISS